MKKVLAFIAIALVAVASQAATVQWKSGVMYTINNADGSVGTVKAKGNVTGVYLIVSAATYDTYKNTSQKLYEDYVANKITTIRKSDPITSNNGGTANWTDATDITAASGTVYGLAVFTQTYEGNTYYIANAGTAFVNDLGGVDGSGFASMGSGSWTAASVPEPTTVALLALGLAALGLKRKVA